MAAVEEGSLHHARKKVVMKVSGWFFLGFFGMVLVSLFFGGCGAQADFTVASVEAEPLVPHARHSLRVSPHVSAAGDMRLAVAVTGQRVTLGIYDIRNMAARDDALRSFTIKSVNGTHAFARIGYAWKETPDDIVDLTAPDASGSVTFLLVASRARLPSGSLRPLRVVGEIAEINDLVSRSHSGDMVSATLVSLVGMNDVSATLDLPFPGPSYILRRSQPFIVASALADTALRTDKLNILSWSVRADPAGDVSVKQFGLHMELRNVEVCEFQLRRNTRLMEANDISMRNLSTGAAAFDKGCLRSSGDLAVTFAKEEVIRSGTDTMFTLRARIARIGAGSSILSRFLRNDESRTTVIACVTGQAPLRLGSADSGIPAVLWSDFSAKPHSDAPCHSSKDWIGDALLADLSVSQLLK